MNDESNNPALSKSALKRVSALESSSTATIGGTTVKIFFMLAVSIIGGVFGWQAMSSANSVGMILIAVASILGLVFALITVFMPKFAAITGTLYALAQGYVLGAMSQVYNSSLDGIVIQAIGLTGAIFFVTLWAFSLGLIKVTQKFRIGVLIATGGIAVYYLVAIIVGLFGGTAPLIFDTGMWGTLFSLVVVFVATMNLIINFDFVQTIVQRGAPKKMEWYAAFGVIVTLLWLYIETLRLLAKVRQ